MIKTGFSLVLKLSGQSRQWVHSPICNSYYYVGNETSLRFHFRIQIFMQASCMLLTKCTYEFMSISVSLNTSSLFFSPLSQFLRSAFSPKVKLGVVGAGTARIFEEAVQAAEGALHVAFTPSKGSMTLIFRHSVFFIYLQSVNLQTSNKCTLHYHHFIWFFGVTG